MQGLSAEVHRGAIPQDAILKFRKGEIIFSQGDPGDCWFEVISGTVRTCHFHVDGHRQLTGFFYQGDVFGVEYGARDAAAEAVTNAVLARRPASNGGPDAPRQSRALERALDSANQCIFLLGRRNANERVAAFLLIAAKRLSAIGSVPLPMTRGDIADHLGLTIHTVSRTISGFVRQGLIELDGPQSCRLLDPGGLRAIAGEEAGMAIDRMGGMRMRPPFAGQELGA
ncbi:helix-turn-helix domain-containing protein [Sphingopyxis sp. LC363]|uniref:helix-turn-helix domain-containing protein n=1 Tax=Sphingopyxis sp. LC363 TaxID=1120705 RepID=UPI00050DADEA|nr:helix-turn-helix domain-containing protein [Sphingopyxis sp. LC363]KGB58532.1 Crp/Fnr family transcription regulator [Sphingopyxis sp. LC363]